MMQCVRDFLLLFSSMQHVFSGVLGDHCCQIQNGRGRGLEQCIWYWFGSGSGHFLIGHKGGRKRKEKEKGMQHACSSSFDSSSRSGSSLWLMNTTYKFLCTEHPKGMQHACSSSFDSSNRSGSSLWLMNTTYRLLCNLIILDCLRYFIGHCTLNWFIKLLCTEHASYC